MNKKEITRLIKKTFPKFKDIEVYIRDENNFVFRAKTGDKLGDKHLRFDRRIPFSDDAHLSVKEEYAPPTFGGLVEWENPIQKQWEERNYIFLDYKNSIEDNFRTIKRRFPAGLCIIYTC